MTHAPLSACLADFLYLTYRTLVILASMIAVAIVTNSDPTPVIPVSRSEFVTATDFSGIVGNPTEHAALVRKVTGKLRLLRLVLERIPKHFTPHKHVPEYRLTYYVETLECGHQRFAFSHDCSAKRRHCSACAFAASLPEKKPVVSVPADQERKQA